jgi:uncharacterized protein (PEP-CTERM system associated)
LFSTAAHYGNNYYDYQNSGASAVAGGFPQSFGLPVSTPGGTGWNILTGNNANGASLAGLLNRVEQSAGIDFQWHVQPQTMLFVGYNFSLVNYIGDEPIGVYNYVDTASHARSVIYKSDSRDSMTHYGYVGAEHEFTANLSGMARLGASYTDSYNDPLNPSTQLNPYADLNVSYTYIPGSYVQLGFTHDVNSTDVASLDSAGRITQYQESSTFYADVNHRITSKLLATLVGRVQYSSYQFGANSGNGDTIYSFGANLNYQINRHFAAEVGYNYDDLVSDIFGRSFERNRVYIGMTANY